MKYLPFLSGTALWFFSQWGLAAPSPSRPDSDMQRFNRFPDASFETGVWSGAKKMPIDASGAHANTGKAALRLAPREDQKGAGSFRTSIEAIRPGVAYRFHLEAAGEAGVPLKMKIHWSVPGQPDVVRKLERKLTGNGFEPFELLADAPAGATAARLYIENWKVGSNLWVDDVFFGEANPDPNAAAPVTKEPGLPLWTKDQGPRISQWLFQPGSDMATAPDEALWEPVEVPFAWTNGTRRLIATPGHSPAPWAKDPKALRNSDNGWFERRIAVPADWAGQRIWLKFDQVDCDAMLWVNDSEPLYIEGPEGRVDLTTRIKPGEEARLRVWVTRWWNGVPKTMDSDPLRKLALTDVTRGNPKNLNEARQSLAAGLTGYVHFEVRPFEAEVESVFARPSWREKALFVDVDLRSTGLKGARIKAEILDPAGKGGTLPGAVEAPLEVTSTGTQTLRVPWEKPRLWQFGDGYLYQLKVSLVDTAGKTIHEPEPVSFGFREIWVDGRKIVMNGRPVHLFIAPAISAHWPSLLFWKGIGFNTMQWHPHPNSWFYQRGRRSLIIDQADDPGLRSIRPNVLAEADREGFGLLMPAPNATRIRGGLGDYAAQEAYGREAKLWIRRLRNHPSILMWMPSMNAGSASRDKPMRVGMNPENPDSIPGWYRAVDETLAGLDPTRIISHHCGLAGQVDYPNQYLNFMPLQERIEFPSHWAEKGDRPWGAIEHGTPAYDADYFKPFGVPLYPEWHAVYFGDRAYEKETDAYVDLVNTSARRAPSGHGNLTSEEKAKIGEMTAHDEFDTLFTRETHRYWRAYGVPGGWKPWNFSSGYGISPKYRKGSFSYTELSEEEARATLEAAPEWANATYHVYRDTLRPLLVFLGGPQSRITAKDHQFFGGETFEKTVIAIWDGNQPRTVKADWKLESGGSVVAQGEETIALQPGEIVRRPITIKAPGVKARTAGRLTLKVRDETGKETDDHFDLSFWPRDQEAVPTRSRWAIYDPKGESKEWLKVLGVDASPVKDHAALKASGAEVLVIGREGLEKSAPFTREDVEGGLRVLVLEQNTVALEALGLRIQDIVTRRAFPRDLSSPILAGIKEEDLSLWRGEPDLVPKTSEGMKKWPLARPPHWGNYGAVASVVIETPHAGAFTPIAVAEFGLNYSPLLEWRHGRGGIFLSQFDLTRRIGTDPVATRIAENLVRTLDQPFAQEQNRTVRYLGDAKGWEYLSRLGFASSRIGAEALSGLVPAGEILVIGPGEWRNLGKASGALKSFVNAGGRALVLTQSAGDLSAESAPFQIGTEPVTRARVKREKEAPILRGIGAPMLHWRSFLKQDRFVNRNDPASAILLEGLMLDRPEGKGEWVFSQLDWAPFEEDNRLFKLPRWNVMKFYRQLLTNLGAKSDEKLAARLTTPRPTALMVTLGLWRNWNNVALVNPNAGPENTFPGLATKLPVEEERQDDDGSDSEVLIATIGEGEVKEPALEKTNSGWRTYGPKASNGFLHLDWISPSGNGKIGYSRTYVYSSREREATFAVGCDWWIVFRVNGKAFVDHTREPRPTNAPYAGEFRFTAPLKAGWNLLEAKVASGGGGFGFWCQISDPGDLVVKASLKGGERPASPDEKDLLGEPEVTPGTLLYARPFEPRDDPYRFNPW